MAAWRSFCDEKQWLLSRSRPLRLRWTRWNQRAAPVLALGSWSWAWSQEVVQRISTATHRVFRLRLHLRRNPEESWVEWHVSPMRRSRGWAQQSVGAFWAHSVLAQCGRGWLAWAQLAPETVLGRTIAWHSSRHSSDTAAVYRAMRAPPHIASRNKRSRPVIALSGSLGARVVDGLGSAPKLLAGVDSSIS